MVETKNGFHTLTLKNVVAMYQKDSTVRKANKSANDVIIALINYACSVGVSLDNVISCECGNSGAILNRGSVAECVIKLIYNGNKSAKKYGAGKVDMINNNIKYEIKLSTNKGYATYNPKQNYNNVIFICSNGAYLTNSDNFILDKCEKHIKTINFKNSKKLFDLIYND